MELLYFLLIGAIAGWLAGKVMKGSGFGLIGNMVVGIIGGFIGGWVFPMIGLTMGGTIGTILMSAGGAILLLFVVGLVTKK